MPLNWSLEGTEIIKSENEWDTTEEEKDFLDHCDLIFGVTHWLYYQKGKNDYGERSCINIGLTTFTLDDIEPFMNAFDTLYDTSKNSAEELKEAKEIAIKILKKMIGLRVWATR